MSGKNTSTLATDSDIHEFDDLEYNARKAGEKSSNLGISTSQKVVDIIDKSQFNLTKMSLGDIKKWTNSPLPTGTIRNRLRDGGVPFQYALATYDVSAYTPKQILSILATSPKPRPDTIEAQHGGDVKAYQEALHQKVILNKRYRR